MNRMSFRPPFTHPPGSSVHTQASAAENAEHFTITRTKRCSFPAARRYDSDGDSHGITDSFACIVAEVRRKSQILTMVDHMD